MPQGKVKWFNNAKGYGFIIANENEAELKGEDLFAHFSSIQMDGYKTLKAGQSVRFEVVPSGKGHHAVNIVPLDMLNSPSPEAQETDGAGREQLDSYEESGIEMRSLTAHA